MVKISMCQIMWMIALLLVNQRIYDRFQEGNTHTVRRYR
jgi:hypothetical protein